MSRPANSESVVIVWFRQDLRLHDNRALSAAAATGHPILPVFIYDQQRASEWPLGEASRWWLYHSLAALNEKLSGNLNFFKGDTNDTLALLTKEHSVSQVFWNKVYEPEVLRADLNTQDMLNSLEVKTSCFDGAYLYPPGSILKDDQTPYKVFTAFYKKAYATRSAEFPEENISLKDLNWVKHENATTLDQMQLMPSGPWIDKFNPYWEPGEDGATKQFNQFVGEGLSDYKKGRDFPSLPNVSRLSPHLHFGEISVAHMWNNVKLVRDTQGVGNDAEHFLRELVWREFSANLLFHFPDLPEENLNRKFDEFSWIEDDQALQRWQKGQTGYPIVDAGMRQLWETGYMHNRVRMIVASFLIKNLLIHWRRGEEWFWDTLVDADLANNSASWQWVAGSGADAAPFFRIFNPVTQGEKFDPDGSYVRAYVPEIAKLPNKYVHKPWETPPLLLTEAGITIGDDYPSPIVDLKPSRIRALDEFKRIK